MSCTQEQMRVIDLQMQALETAGNLAQISKTSNLTGEQAKQFAQLFVELLPVFGSIESAIQLITGKTSMSGEDSSRFWAAVGLIPVAGGMVHKVGEPTAEAIAALMRGGEAVKPFVQASEETWQTASALQAAQLHHELAGLAKLKPDTSRDAFYIANIDKKIMIDNKFDMNHVLAGEMNAAERATGYHWENAADGASRILPGATVTRNANGTYEALVQIWNSNRSEWTTKVNYQGVPIRSTFMNPTWSEARMSYEVTEAFKARSPSSGTSGIGISPSGVKFQFYVNASRTTFFPLKD